LLRGSPDEVRREVRDFRRCRTGHELKLVDLRDQRLMS
jgi:hypothetical protein